MPIFIPNTAIPAKKYFCYNLFSNKLVIVFWGIPDALSFKFPKLTTFDCTVYSKFGIRWKKFLFEIVWNKRHYSFD
jgi:hypothetical protein